MASQLGSLDQSLPLADRGLDLASLGAAYLGFLATTLLTVAGYIAARKLLVIAPNRGTRDYGTYVSLTLATLLMAIVLENELLPVGGATLHYALVPQLLALLGLHVWIWRQQEPWLIALGAAAAAATIVVGTLAVLATDLSGPVYGISLLLLAALLAFLWRQAVSTQRAFASADTIYLRSKEGFGGAIAPQKPWLGLAQWVALVTASLALGVANAVLRGRRLEEIPAYEVAADSGLLLVATALVCAVPAVAYWVSRKAWMPELTRIVWLAWIVIAFALTYGNYLNSLMRA